MPIAWAKCATRPLLELRSNPSVAHVLLLRLRLRLRGRTDDRAVAPLLREAPMNGRSAGWSAGRAGCSVSDSCDDITAVMDASPSGTGCTDRESKTERRRGDRAMESDSVSPPAPAPPAGLRARAARAALVAVLLAPVVLAQGPTTIAAVEGVPTPLKTPLQSLPFAFHSSDTENDRSAQVDVGAAGGEAIFSQDWVEFPGPPATLGGSRSGYVAYAFSCVAPSTVAWQLSTIAADGDSDSVLLQVDSPSDEGWVTWALGGLGSSLEEMVFVWSSTSASFPVDAGPHSLLIAEREVRHAGRRLAVV